MPRGKDEPKTLGVLGANPFQFGEQTRAKDAKVKGKVVKEPVPKGAKLRRKHPFSTGCVSLTRCHRWELLALVFRSFRDFSDPAILLSPNA